MRDTVLIKEFFNRVGPWIYSFFFTLVGYRSSLKYFVRHNHQRFDLKRGIRILDAGIGTGFLTVNFLKEVPILLKIIGLDFSAGMFVGLKRRLRRMGLEGRVMLQMGDMRRLPFVDESFDMVASSAAMEYLPDVEEGISECGRILRPGGRILIISTRDTFMGKVIAALWRNKTLEPIYVKECMRRAGIEHIETLRFPWYFPHVNWWGMALLGKKARGLNDL
jgi:ubiquinone/menaquinone biosynthesis C-methylase UbiE